MNFIYYQEGNFWIGWLEAYPDYRTQGKTLDELKENLKEIYDDLDSGNIPNVRKRGELVIGWNNTKGQAPSSLPLLLW